jgi:hypothetical protein
METVDRPLENPDERLQEVADRVCDTNSPVTVRTAKGNAVRIVPVPKPIGYRRGVPIYRDEDIQFLYPDHSYWFDK